MWIQDLGVRFKGPSKAREKARCRKFWGTVLDMLKERNKELALLMLRNMINDIAEDRYIVMDVKTETKDIEFSDAGVCISSGIPLESIFQFRLRLAPEKK